jgi:benzoyl-CoA reductase/2-hydroxyglutaryl-CoA dehydratase subunit BcrC/BadD/HgdB
MGDSQGKTLSLSRILREIETIASLGYREIASQLTRDRTPVGFFCPHVPEELIYAAGGHPFRLMGTPAKISHAQVHLPPYCCYLTKSSLESLLQGELDFLKGIIFSNSCDSMQGLSDIWALQKRFPLHLNLMIPSNLASEQARIYLRAELERFRDDLGSHLGKVTAQNLKTSIQLFNGIRENLKGGSFAQLIRAGFLMDRFRYLELLKELLNSLEEESEGNRDLVPVYITGNMVHSPSWFSLIEEAGGQVVWDNLCSGARSFSLMVREEGDPMEGLTERYFNSFFCPY